LARRAVFGRTLAEHNAGRVGASQNTVTDPATEPYMKMQGRTLSRRSYFKP